MSPARLVGLLVLLFSVAVFAPLSLAQLPPVSNTTSTPIPGAGHDYLAGFAETVNPANGSISITIPVPMPPSRGITLPFSFTYESSGVHYLAQPPNPSGLNSAWYSSGSIVSSGGWSNTAPTISATAINWQTTDDSGTRTLQCSAITNYVFQDTRGNRHNLNLTTYSDPSGTAPCSTNTSDWPLGFDGIVATKGGEGSILATMPTGFASSNEVTVTNADGAILFFPSHVVTPTAPGDPTASWLAATVTDRNGNTLNISSSGSSYSYTDSARRTVLQDSGFGATPETVTVSGLAVPYTLNWEALPNPSFPTQITPPVTSGTQACPAPAPANQNSVLSSILLPNGKSFTFGYDLTYGLLNKITYPTGGYVRYGWGMYPIAEYAQYTTTNGQSFFACSMYYSVPAVTDRYVSYDGVNEVEHQHFQYAPPQWDATYPFQWDTKVTTVTTYDLVRNTSFQTVYTYTPVSASQPPNMSSGLPAQIPVESTVAYSDTNGAPLKTVTKTWGNGRLLMSDQTAYSNGQTAKTAYNYDANEMPTEQDDYDFGPNAPGSLLRKTITNYAYTSNTTLANNHVIDKASSVVVYDGNNNRVAETDFTYDTPAATVTSGIVQHSGGCNCGNVTSESHWLNTSGSDLTTSYTNDDTGQRLTMTDPRGNTTTYSYADNYSSGTPPGPTNAYLTQVTHPNTGVAHIEKFGYAYASGELTSSTDQNNQVTNYNYNDSLARLTETDFPDGGKTTLAYNDASYNPSAHSPSVLASRLISANQYVTSLAAFDGLGHTVETLRNGSPTSDPDCPSGDRTDTTYDGLGRVFTVSNPYCSTGDPTYGVTTYAYDALGRTLQVTHPDNSTVLTSYTGRATQVQDEGNGNGSLRVTRVSQTDGLGRLASVCEVSSTTQIGQNGSPTTCPQDIGGSGFLTSYQYDVLGNLTEVDQGTMAPRAFAYDSLSRLTTATNPESGTITYSYDANGNLASKTAPAPNIASSTATLVGTQTIASSPDNNTPGSAEAFQATAASTGELSSITVYVDAPNTATQLFAGIYSDSSGQPGNLLTQGSSGSLQAGAWNTVEVPPVSLTAGTPYWIAILASSGTLAFRDGSGCTSISSQEENLTSLPDAWTSGQSYPTCPLSAYGSGEILNGSTTVTTTYQYDALNRLTQKTYSDNLTQSASYYYDSYPNFSPANPVGRLVVSGTSSPVGGCIDTLTSYDSMGRVSDEWQYLPSFPNCDANYGMPYTYDLMGNMTSYFNGYFNPVSATYSPVGRLTSLTPSSYGWYGSAPANFLSNATYNAAGQITSDTLGTIENETFSYDNRMRLQSESSTLTSTSTQDYSFSLSFAPNGDVLSANDSANGNWNYSYDEFNRLVCANLASNGTCPASGTPTYSYVYDRFGNRWHQNGPLSFSATFTGNSPSSPANNNRVDGLTYDAAGNLLNDGVHNYFYDAENRLIQVDGSLDDCSSTSTLAHATACYYYDANGRRVWRTGFTNDSNCGGDTTGQRGYIYDLDGRWLSSVNKVSGTSCLWEIYAGSRHVATNPGGRTVLDHTDWLGTSRVRTDYQLTTSHGFWLGQSCTSLPFGDGLDCTDANYFALHFTGKERDSESGLDNFGARYNSSSMGRFMSPDPVGGHNEDPQTLNRYVYVRNNPLKLTDPTGLDFYLQCNHTDQNKDTCQQVQVGDQKVWVQGTTGDKGKFNATVVTSASLQDPNSGNTATVNQSGLQITTANGTAQGVFITGTPAANNVQGSAGLSGFTFDINGNCGGTCLSSGSFKFGGTPEQAEAALKAAGAFNYGFWDALNSTQFGHHPFTDQFRFGSGPSPHLSVPWPVIPGLSEPGSPPIVNPEYTVPAKGDFHVDATTGSSHFWCANLGIGCNK